jgi:hypothetical protein
VGQQKQPLSVIFNLVFSNTPGCQGHSRPLQDQHGFKQIPEVIEGDIPYKKTPPMNDFDKIFGHKSEKRLSYRCPANCKFIHQHGLIDLISGPQF